jgi:formylglycine-generating enzyme required for sulfatase activity
MPQHELDLPAFRIGKYPITNLQYDAFVRDGGYTERWRRCWTTAGWQRKEDRTGPEKYGGVFDLPNHPVVMVSWYEAFAFCNWLGEKLNLKVALPTEAQWEKAARGPSPTRGGGVGVGVRRYPWGNEITPDHANYGETGIGTTSAAGIFSKGVSPYGTLDMSGNVWEWTLSLDRPYPYLPDDGRNAPEAEGARVVRGGSWYDLQGGARCAFRSGASPTSSTRTSGFGWLRPYRILVSDPSGCCGFCLLAFWGDGCMEGGAPPSMPGGAATRGLGRLSTHHGCPFTDPAAPGARMYRLRPRGRPFDRLRAGFGAHPRSRAG